MESFLSGLGLVLVGLVSAFLGYRMFRILLPVYGGIAGFLVAWGWLGDGNVILALIVGVVLAVILGVLAYGIWSVLVGLGGVILGLALASIIATSLNLGSWLAVIGALALAVVFGALFVKVRNEMVIFLTGIVGAAAIARGIGEWFGLRSGFDAARNPNPAWLILLMVVIFVVLAFLGIRYQWLNYRRQKAQAEVENAAAALATTSAATASRRTSTPVSVDAPAVAEVPAGGGVAEGVPPAGAIGAAGLAIAGAAAVAEDKPAEVAPGAGAVVEAPVAVAVATELAVGEPEAVEVVAAEAVETEAVAVEAAAGEAAAEIPVSEAAITDVAVAGAGVAGAVVAAATDDRPAELEEAVVEPPVVAEAATVEVLAGSDVNKVEDTLPAEAAAHGGDADVDAVSANVIDQVVNGIEKTYSFDDIAKFREKLEYVEGIGFAYAEKLVAAGVTNVLDLLKRGATRKGRQELVEATGISAKLILRWVNHADLYRIKGVGSEHADLLEAAGVDTVVELAHRNPANLFSAMTDTNKGRKLVRKEPVVSQVEDWVAQAKTLPRVIQY